MRFKTIAFVGVLACSFPLVSEAQSASGTVNVTATVAAKCTIPPLTTHSLDFSKPSAGSPSSVIDIVTKSAIFAGATCNVATHVSLFTFSGGASGGNFVADAGHQNFFDYTAVATFDTAVATLNTSPYAKGAQTPTITSALTSTGPVTGNLTVDVTPINPTHGLVAGIYADQIRVTLTAQ